MTSTNLFLKKFMHEGLVECMNIKQPSVEIVRFGISSKNAKSAIENEIILGQNTYLIKIK